MLPEKLRLRLSTVTAILAVLVLIDEVVKEGYTFNPYDVINPSITHEKLFILLILLSLTLGWKRR